MKNGSRLEAKDTPQPNANHDLFWTRKKNA